MKVRVNGDDHVLPDTLGTLKDLIHHLDIASEGLIIEQNGELYRQEHFDQQTLQEGDTVECIRFMGGG